MGLYTRGNKIWLRFQDATGRWRSASSGYNVGDEGRALQVLAEVESRIAADRGTATAGSIISESGGSERLARYARRWLAKRKGETSNDDGGRIELHIIPMLGHLRLAEIRPKHIRDFIAALLKTPKRRRRHDGVLVTTGEMLAPRTVRAIYSNLRVMLNDAVADELIPVSPCSLKKGDLPGRRDKDPTWRRTAVFTRDEVETILSAPLDAIPEDRRMFYSLLFLGAMRFGEAAALTWGDYDPACSPLGKLAITKSYNTEAKVVKATKTDNPREMPVHATLARILAEWKLSGWERFTGRKPKPGDLIVPSRQARPRNVNHGRKRFHQDLARIGLRARRQHDARRTFISIARADGARPDVLRWATHGPTGDIVDVYTTLPWPALCEEVAKLKIAVREGKVIAMPKAAAGGGGDGGAGSLQPPLQSSKVATSYTKLEGVRGTPGRGERVPGDTIESAGVIPLGAARTAGRHDAAEDRDEPLHLDDLLAEVVERVRSVIETQARTSYWRAKGIALPDGFAIDAARNAAGALVELLHVDDEK